MHNLGPGNRWHLLLNCTSLAASTNRMNRWAKVGEYCRSRHHEIKSLDPNPKLDMEMVHAQVFA
jgi:hypothetical protein